MVILELQGLRPCRLTKEGSVQRGSQFMGDITNISLLGLNERILGMQRMKKS